MPPLASLFQSSFNEAVERQRVFCFFFRFALPKLFVHGSAVRATMTVVSLRSSREGYTKSVSRCSFEIVRGIVAEPAVAAGTRGGGRQIFCQERFREFRRRFKERSVARLRLVSRLYLRSRDSDDSRM